MRLQERARAYVGVIAAFTRPRAAARRLLFAAPVQHKRSAWVRGLRLYRTAVDARGGSPPQDADGLFDLEAQVHARSRFRSAEHPERYAEYTLREPGVLEAMAPGDHTLIVVREFRRVPLHASALRLVLFAARLGREAAVVATLAHFAERALSLYQPPYLLLARSAEQPGITMLLTGIQASALLESGHATPFSVDALLPELTPLLAVEPELYAYAPDREPASVMAVVAPYAV